jgi:hypothetical protein
VFAAPNVRYALPAFALAAALLACALPRLGRLRHLVELLALLAVANGLRHGLFVHDGRLAAGVVAALGLTVAVVIVRRLPGRVLAVALAGCAVAIVALGFARQRDFYDQRYRGSDAALDFLSSTPHGTRVGLAGFETGGALPHVLPAFGEDLDNRVQYVGEDYKGQLRAYEQPARFTAALARGRFDYLLVAPKRYAVGCALPGEDAQPARWAESAGWRRVTQSPSLALYRRP